MSSNSKIDGRRIDDIGRLLADARMRFGITRIEIGAILCTVQDEGLWQGRAESYRDYLSAEAIRPEQARSYQKVARKIFHELALPEIQVRRLARMSMKTLEKVAEVMTRDNALDLIDMLEDLSEPDANEVLEEMLIEQQEKNPKQKKKKLRVPAVQRLMDSFWALPEDRRIEVLNELRVKPVASRQETRASEATGQ